MKLEIVNHNGSVVEPANGSMLAPSSGDGDRVARSSTNGHILAPGSKEASAAAKPLRGLAVVGLGYWGPNWIRNFSTLQCAQRLVACDLNSERLSHLKELYPNLETSQKFEEVLQDPDIEGHAHNHEQRERFEFDPQTPPDALKCPQRLYRESCAAL